MSLPYIYICIRRKMSPMKKKNTNESIENDEYIVNSKSNSPSAMGEKTMSPLVESVITIPSSQVLPSLVNYTLIEGKLIPDLSATTVESEKTPFKIVSEEESPMSSKVSENVSFTELINSYCDSGKKSETEDLIILLNSWKIPVQYHQYFVGKFKINLTHII